MTHPVKDEDSLATFGTDCYYWSRSGPNVVIGGEAVTPLGSGAVRRYLTDQAWTAPASTDNVFGAADSERPLIAWCHGPKSIGIAYDAAGDAWSTFVGPPGGGTALKGMCTGAERLNTSSHPLDGIDFLANTGIASQRRRYSHATLTLAATLATKLWLPYSSKRSTLHYIRTLYRALEETNGGLATVTPTITLETSSDPLFSSPATATPSQAHVDPNGYITGADAGLPVEAHAFRLTLNIPEFTGMISSLVGFDLVAAPGSAMY